MIARSGKAIAEQLTIEGFYCDPDQRNAFLIIGDMSTIMGIVFVSCAHIISQVFLPLALILYPSELETCDRRLRRRCCGIGIIFLSHFFSQDHHGKFVNIIVVRESLREMKSMYRRFLSRG